LLRYSDHCIFLVVWLEAEYIYEHIADIDEHLLFLVKDEHLPMNQGMHNFNYSQLFKFAHIAQSDIQKRRLIDGWLVFASLLLVFAGRNE
jgi:hypothetical protein